MILLIRHAEKSLTGNQTLTNQGLDDAFNYGRKLKQQDVYFDEITSSPVERCIQTVEKIIEGLEYAPKVQQSNLLGNPGMFVENDKKAAKAFDRFTVCQVINLMLKREAISGFLPIDKACIKMCDEIRAKIRLKKSILYVSHDAIIMPFMAYVSKIKTIHESEIIGYLGGYAVEKRHNSKLDSDKIKLRQFVL